MNSVEDYFPTARDIRFFAKAKDASNNSNYVSTAKPKKRIAIGAAIVKGNYVVSVGWNRNKTHVLQNRYNKQTGYICPSPKIHAEVDALIKSGRHDLIGADIYLYRATRDGTGFAMCRPCKSCRRALHDAGVRHVHYTHPQGYGYFDLTVSGYNEK